MGTIETIRIAMVADTKGVDKGCKQAADSVDGLVGRLTSASTAFKALAGAAVVAGIVKATGAIVGLAKEAATLEEGVNKLDAVFGKASKGIQDSARDLAGTFGISINEVVSDLGRMGSMMGGAGFGQQAAATMSDSLVKLANDLSRFNDTSFEEAFQKIRSGLAGESEPLRDFGIFLTEDAVKARALKMGLVSLGGTVTDQMKIQARANIIFEQSGPAIGAAAREADGTSAKLEALSGRWTNLKIAIGETFAPAVGWAVGGVNEVLKALEASWKNNADASEKWGDRAKKAAQGVAEAVPKPADPGGWWGGSWGLAETGIGAVSNAFRIPDGRSTKKYLEDYYARLHPMSAPPIPGASTPFLDKTGIAKRDMLGSATAFATDFTNGVRQSKDLWGGVGRTMGVEAVDSIKHGLDAMRLAGPGLGAAGAAASAMLGGPKGRPRDIVTATGQADAEAIRAAVAAVKPAAKAFADGLADGGLSEAISRSLGPDALLKTRGVAVGAGALGGVLGPLGGIARGLVGGMKPGPQKSDANITRWLDGLQKKAPAPISTGAMRLGSAEATRAMAMVRTGAKSDPVARNTGQSVMELKKLNRAVKALNMRNTAGDAAPVFVA